MRSASCCCSRASGVADVDFERDVRPILQKHCHRCHGEKKQEGGLRLDIRRWALAAATPDRRSKRASPAANS